jgi:hypothetical protein
VPNSGQWQTPTWQAINFGLDDPHYFSYQVVLAIGTGSSVGDQAQLQASADLNCDAVNFSLFQRTVSVAAGLEVVSGGGGMYTVNELE